MIKAYMLYTGGDGHSHVRFGSISAGALVAADSVLFQESPAHSSFDWHNAPAQQYVLTLSGVLEFTTKTGESFTLQPGEVLLALDHTGSGHKWRLVDNDPWRRVYVVFRAGADTHFIGE